MLLIGSGVLADSLAKALAGQGVGFERAPCAQAASTARALAPDLVLLAGDAANDRGAAVLGQLAQTPALVICAPELGGLAPQTPTPRHVGYLPPEGGVTECARRVRALIGLFGDEGLATCSMQQFADTVSSRAQASPTTIKVSIPTKPATPSIASAPRPKITLQGATVSASPTAVSAKAPAATAGPTSIRSAIARANPAPAAPQATAVAASPAAAAPAQVAPAIQPQPAQAKSVAKPAPVAQAAAPSVTAAQPAKAEPKKTAPIARAAAPSVAVAQPAKVEQPKPTPVAQAAASSVAVAQPVKAEQPKPMPVAQAAAASVAVAQPQPEPDESLSEPPPDEEEVTTVAWRPAMASLLTKPEPANAAQTKPPPLQSTAAKPAREAAAAAPVPAAKTVAKAEPVAPTSDRPTQPPGPSSDAAAAIVVANSEPPTNPPAAHTDAAEAIVLAPSERSARSSESSAAIMVNVSEPPVSQSEAPSEVVFYAASVPPAARADASDAIVVAASDPPGSSTHSSADAIMVAISEPAPRTSVVEPDILVSTSEPAPSATATVSVPGTPPKLPRKKQVTAVQTFTATAPKPSPAAAPAAVAKPAPAAAPQPTPAAARQPVLAAAPQPEPAAAPQPAPVATQQPAAASDVVQPRAPRRVRNPLDAAPAWQPATSTAFANTSATFDAPPAKKRGTAVFLALAAVSCVAVVGWVFWSSGDPRGPVAALGSLKRVERSAPETLDPASTERAVTPSAPDTTPSQPLDPIAQAAVAPTLPAGAIHVPRPGEQPHDATGTPTAPAGTPTGATTPQGLVNEGTALLKQGRLGLAESSYQKALAAAPDNVAAIVGLVRVHLARRDGAEAVRWAKRLVSMQPSNGVNQLLLGDAQNLYGDIEAAQKAWTAAAESGNALARQRLEE